MKFLEHGRITLKGSKAQDLIKPKTKRTRPVWQTIELMEEQTEQTVTERVKPMRKAWRPYLKNQWNLSGYAFRVLLATYKTGTPMQEVQFIARLLVEIEREGRKQWEKRQNVTETRLPEHEFKRQLRVNAWDYGTPLTDNELIGVLA